MSVKEVRGEMDASGRRFAVVVSRWNELVTNALLQGALDELKAHAAPEVEVIRVPGTWEMPAVVAALLRRPEDSRPHAVIALGCILQGQTPHAGLLAKEVSSALMGLQTEHGVPVAWGVLTPDTQEQALDRVGMKHGNKGREAALAAMEMASVLGKL